MKQCILKWILSIMLLQVPSNFSSITEIYKYVPEMTSVKNHSCTSNVLSKHFYRIGAIQSPPYMMCKSDENKNWITCKGIIIDILNILQSKLNFTLVPLTAFGTLLQNGTWIGAIGSIIRDEVDIVCADLSKTPARARVVDYTIPYLKSSVGVLIRKPTDNPTILDRLRTYIHPFHWSIWLVMLIYWLLASITFYLIERRKTTDGKPVQENKFQCKVTWWSTMFHFMGLFCQKGCALKPQRQSGRIIFFTVCLTAFSCYSFYTSVLVSFTTVTKISNPINSLGDLLRDKSYEVGFVEGSYTDVLVSSKVPAYKEAWSRIQKAKEPFVKTTEDGILRAYNEKFALLEEFNSAKWFLQGQCEYKVLNEHLFSDEVYFVLPKSSPDTVLFSKYIRLLITTGLMARITSLWIPKIQPESCKVTSSFEAVGLEETVGIFVCLTLGIIFAQMSLCLEICIFRLKVYLLQDEKGR